MSFITSAGGAVAGTGGQLVTGNVSLTATSAATINASPTTWGMYATLPDATGLSKAVNIFTIYNTSDYDYGIKDASGTVLGWLRPRSGSLIGLSDNTTVAGGWTVSGVEKTAVTASYQNLNLVFGSIYVNVRRVAIDANRTLLLLFATNVYGVVYDSSTLTWGAISLLRSNITGNGIAACLSATNQILMVSCDATTGFQAVTLTIAGTSITVNTPVASVLASNNAGAVITLLQVGASFVAGYSRTAFGHVIVAISISGIVPTIGAEGIVENGAGTDGTKVYLYASGSIVRTVAYNPTGTLLVYKPFTVSGSTLAAGTGGTITIKTTINPFDAMPTPLLDSNGNLVFVYNTIANISASILKLTGTVEAISTVVVSTIPALLASYLFCYTSLIGNKVFVWYSVNYAAWYCNLITDSAGTASIGTEVVGTFPGSNYYGANSFGVSMLNPIGTTAKMLLGSTRSLFTFDCSGSNVSNTKIVYSSMYGNITTGLTGSPFNGIYPSSSTNGAFFVGNGLSDSVYYQNSVKNVLSLNNNLTTFSVIGYSASNFYPPTNFSDVFGTTSIGASDISIVRIEVAT